MESISRNVTADGSVRIEGFPDAAKVIQLNCAKAKELADLSLHQIDLGFAISCLEQIDVAEEHPPNASHSVPPHFARRHALWESAIVHYFKCFGRSASRSKLIAREVYENDEGPLGSFDHLKNIRDKHLVHDENSIAQCVTVAGINPKGSKNKVAKVVSTSLIGGTLLPENYSNLLRLAKIALTWVGKQIDACCESITADLEKLDHDELLGREAFTTKYNWPKADDFGKRRVFGEAIPPPEPGSTEPTS